MPHSSESLQAAFKYLFAEEVQALKELALSLPDAPHVLNIGSGSGTSSLALLEARPDLFLYCVDIEAGNSPLGGLFGERQVLSEAGFDGRYTQIQADSAKLGKDWGKPELIDLPDIKFDLIFVDGGHSYEEASGDILAWLPHIKPGGIMAVHDYEKERVYAGTAPDDAPHPLPWPGVDQAVNEILVPNFKVVSHVKTLIAFKVTVRGRGKLGL